MHAHAAHLLTCAWAVRLLGASEAEGLTAAALRLNVCVTVHLRHKEDTNMVWWSCMQQVLQANPMSTHHKVCAQGDAMRRAKPQPLVEFVGGEIQRQPPCRLTQCQGSTLVQLWAPAMHFSTVPRHDHACAWQRITICAPRWPCHTTACWGRRSPAGCPPCSSPSGSACTCSKALGRPAVRQVQL